ncbi:hypothetical protein KPL51_01235 [Clostridium bowmanii]|nr:hypothetical protein [Clostridium bowmanii]
MKITDRECLVNYLIYKALKNNNLKYLIIEAINELKKSKVLLPSIVTIENIIIEVRNYVDNEIFDVISTSVSNEQKKSLDILINVQSTEKKLNYPGFVKYQGSPHQMLSMQLRIELSIFAV